MAVLGMVVMVRDEEMERLNGAAYTEVLLVHEKAHGNSVDNNVACEKEDGHLSYALQRTGFSCSEQWGPQAIQCQGSFFEEGFAECLAGLYSMSQLGRWYGPWPDDIRPRLGSGLDAVHAHYLWRGDAYDPARVAYGDAAFAATGLACLIDRRRELWPALVSARTSVQGLRDVARIVESAGTGLYDRLRRLSYSSDDFSAGLRAIQSLPPRSLTPRTAATPGPAREQLATRQPQVGANLLIAALSPHTLSPRPGPPRLRTAHHRPVATTARNQPDAGRPSIRQPPRGRGSGTTPGLGSG